MKRTRWLGLWWRRRRKRMLIGHWRIGIGGSSWAQSLRCLTGWKRRNCWANPWGSGRSSCVGLAQQIPSAAVESWDWSLWGRCASSQRIKTSQNQLCLFVGRHLGSYPQFDHISTKYGDQSAIWPQTSSHECWWSWSHHPWTTWKSWMTCSCLRSDMDSHHSKVAQSRIPEFGRSWRSWAAWKAYPVVCRQARRLGPADAGWEK